MKCKRLLAAVIVVCVHAVSAPAVLAQDPPEPSGEPAGAAEEMVAQTPEPEPEKKLRFALYVEASYGAGEADDIDTSIETRSTEVTSNTLTLDDNLFGRGVIGWKLPEGRGSFLLRYEGYKEDSYSFVGVGSQSRVPDSTALATEPLQWWMVQASDGHQSSAQFPPHWTPPITDNQGNIIDPGDDANGNFKPDPEEVNYDSVPAAGNSSAAPKNLQNRTQTIDILYQRDFGGRKTSGRWSTGIRYFTFEGNTPAAAWLVSATVKEGVGFTDGALVPLLSLNQDSKAMGPTGSLEIQQHFFRDRLVLYAQGRAAFLIQSATVDSGPFYTFVRDPSLSTLVVTDARLRKELDKSIWHTGVDAGARIELAKGLHLHLAFALNAYMDALVLPTAVITPDLPQQAGQGTSGIFKTKDVTMTGWYGGLSFQY